jgi:demethylmenaquinone methyltransferase/2-methoxy-6-polyprenyl-1,4-benzoquinol methylase
MVVDKSSRRVRSMFAQIAGRYDFLNHLLSGGTDIYWRWRTARAARAAKGPVLDVCTGTGDLAFAFRRRLGNGVPIVGTDFTREMLVLAGKKDQQFAQKRKQSPVTFLEADAEALPFADESFGLVSVAFGLRNVANTEQGLREMIRVCRTGGDLMVLEFSRPNVPVLGGLYGWYFRRVLPRIGQMLARNKQSAYDYLPESVGEFPSGRALVAILELCGLSDVRYTPLTLGVATLYHGRKSSPIRAAESAELPLAVASP